MKRRSIAGTTFMELIAAALIVSVVAGGTMAAFLAAARMARQQNVMAIAEASGFAQQQIEGMRNQVARDPVPPDWLDSRVVAAPPVNWADPAWQDDDPALAGGGSDSILAQSAERKYYVVKEDCDKDGVKGDCYAVTVRVCWNGCGP